MKGFNENVHRIIVEYIDALKKKAFLGHGEIQKLIEPVKRQYLHELDDLRETITILRRGKNRNWLDYQRDLRKISNKSARMEGQLLFMRRLHFEYLDHIMGTTYEAGVRDGKKAAREEDKDSRVAGESREAQGGEKFHGSHEGPGDRSQDEQDHS